MKDRSSKGAAVRTQDRSYPFRVFVSYAHEDHRLAARLLQALRDLQLRPYCDESIGAGMPFTDEIKGLIAHAHVFMPLITQNAQQRPWVHQETGYAMALNIPVLPVAVHGVLPEDMTAQLQAITVRKDMRDAKEKLAAISFERVVFPPPRAPEAMIDVADLPEERTRLLASYPRRIVEYGHYGLVRQRGAFSSFCLPDAGPLDKLWELREGLNQRSEYHRILQREERRMLEVHARAVGCRLIVDPTIDLLERGETAAPARLHVLLQFLDSMADDKIQVVTSTKAGRGSLTIVGDWFAAESQLPKPGGYQQTVFKWHAPTVLTMARRFDQEFEGLAKQGGIDLGCSRLHAIKAAKAALHRHPGFGAFKLAMSRPDATRVRAQPAGDTSPAAGETANEQHESGSPGKAAQSRSGRSQSTLNQ